MEVEYRNMRKSELTEGQATAMRCALEERRRMLLETQIRMDTEAKDAQFARCAHDEEADFLAKCGRDDEYARQLYDEQCAELLQENEEKEALLLKERLDIDSAADEKVRCYHFRSQKLFKFVNYNNLLNRHSLNIDPLFLPSDC